MMGNSVVNEIHFKMFRVYAREMGRSQDLSLLLACSETLQAKDATPLQERAWKSTLQSIIDVIPANK